MRNYTRIYARACAHTHTHKSRSHIHCSCISVGLPVCLWVFLPSFLYCQALCNICLTVSVLVSELRAWLFVLGCCLNWTAGVSVVIVTKCFQRPAYFFIFVLFMYTYCTRSFILVRILGRYFVKWTRNHIYSRQTIRSLTVQILSPVFYLSVFCKQPFS